MTPMQRLLTLSATALVIATAGACDLGAIFPPARLDVIDVEGDTVVAVGDTLRLTATGTRGLVPPIPDPLWDASWVSMDPRIARVMVLPRTRADSLASAALATGVQTGRVVIQVSARGVTATHIVEVR